MSFLDKSYPPISFKDREEWGTIRIAPLVGTTASILLHLLILGLLFAASQYSPDTNGDQTLPSIQVTLASPVMKPVKADKSGSITASRAENHTDHIETSAGRDSPQNEIPDERTTGISEPTDAVTTMNQKTSLISPDEFRSLPLPPGGSTAGTVVVEVNTVLKEDMKSVAASTSLMPRYLKTPFPVYPAAARMNGQEGLVLLSVCVLEDGRVGLVRIKKTSGHAILDQSAMTAIRSWRFEPARRNNIPQAVTVDIPVRFSLKEGSP